MGIWEFLWSKMDLKDMIEIILDRIEQVEHVEEEDVSNLLGLKDADICKDFNMNGSFWHGSSIEAQTMKILLESHINDKNRWR